MPSEPTAEGNAAIAGAIALLEVQQALPALIWSEGLYLAA